MTKTDAWTICFCGIFSLGTLLRLAVQDIILASQRERLNLQTRRMDILSKRLDLMNNRQNLAEELPQTDYVAIEEDAFSQPPSKELN